MVTTFHCFLLPFNHFEQNTFNSVVRWEATELPRRSGNLLLKDLVPSLASGDADLRITTYFVQQ